MTVPFIAGILLLPTTGADPLDSAVELTASDVCVTDEAGFGTEEYACKIDCLGGEYVGALIDIDQQVDTIVLNADCGSAFEANRCEGKSQCHVESRTDVAAAGECGGFSNEENWVEYYRGTMWCWATGSPITSFYEAIQGVSVSSFECETFTQENSELAQQSTTLIGLDFEYGDGGQSGKGVSISSSGCKPFTLGNP